MPEFIGTLFWEEFLAQPSVRREALLFDSIAVGGLNSFKEKFNREQIWLAEQGIINEPEIQYTDGKKRSFFEYWDDSDVDSVGTWRKEDRDLMEHLRARPFDLPGELNSFQLMQRWVAFSGARSYAAKLRHWNGLDACSISTCLSFPHLPKTTPESEPNVFHVVLNTLPMPDDTVSWEEVLEYRSDPDSYSKFLALRNWIKDVSKNKLTPIEIEQKLEYLMDQYDRHMKVHKMKTTAGTLETIVVSTAEILEDLVKFKWGKMAKSLFSFRQRKVALLEGELKAPGSEIAYIVKSKEAF